MSILTIQYVFTTTNKETTMFSLNKKEKAVIGTLVGMGHECSVRGDGWYIDETKFETFKEFWEKAVSLLPECKHS